jgi:hypothetical protein
MIHTTADETTLSCKYLLLHIHLEAKTRKSLIKIPKILNTSAHNNLEINNQRTNVKPIICLYQGYTLRVLVYPFFLDHL